MNKYMNQKNSTANELLSVSISRPVRIGTEQCVESLLLTVDIAVPAQVKYGRMIVIHGPDTAPTVQGLTKMDRGGAFSPSLVGII